MHNLNSNSLILSYIAQNQFGNLIDASFTIIDFGIVDYFLTIDERHLATPKAVHGGVLSALLDATVGVGALSTVCEENKVVSTVEMKVTFFAPAFLGDQLISSSEVLKKGKRLIFMEGKILNQHGILIAKASATLNAYPMEKAGY